MSHTEGIVAGTDGPQDAWRGGWSKFSRYEIRGDRIRPTDDAHIEHYNPWEIYRKSKTLSGGQPPYQDLLALVPTLGGYRDRDSGRWGLRQSSWDNDQRAQVLAWCEKYGLLGILPHVAHGIILNDPFGVDHGYRRVNGKWIDKVPGGTPVLEVEPEYFSESDFDPHSLLLCDSKPSNTDNGWFSEDAVLAFSKAMYGEVEHERRQIALSLRSMKEVTPRTLSLHEVTEQYFPEQLHRGPLFPCPKPLTDKFWRIYSEKLESFARYAVMFAAAVHDPVPPADGRRPDPFNPGIEQFISPIGVSVESDQPGRVSEHWECPSLLSSFARMALTDRISGKLLVKCECCGNPFPSDSNRAKYCSKQCGFKYRKRVERAKRRERNHNVETRSR